MHPPEKRRPAPARTGPEIAHHLPWQTQAQDSLDLARLQAASLAARYRLPIEHAALIASILFARVAS
jgi:hypothetical protein